MKFSTAFVSSTAVLLSELAAAGVYDRPLAYPYALSGGKGLPYTDAVLLRHFDQVNPPITSMLAFFLNVENVAQYEPMINALTDRNITIIPAIGGPPLNNVLTSYKTIAKGYKQYTDYIRLETGEGYIEAHGIQSVQDMITYCVNTLGFKHIVLNPWPEVNGQAYKFPNPEVEATFDNVLYPSDTPWYPANQNKIQAVRSYRPSAEILVNYESPGQQQDLVDMENKKKGSSIDAMQITVNEINGQYKGEKLRWAPPLGKSYDAIALGTWDWIAQTLSKQVV